MKQNHINRILPLRWRLLLGIAATALSCSCGLFASTGQGISGFAGEFSVGNWTLLNSNADGFVATSNAPDGVTVVGGDIGVAGSGAPGRTYWSITTTNSGLLNFDWVFATRDSSFGAFDLAAWSKGTNNFALSANNSTNWAGHVAALVPAGTTFGFWVETRDNLGGSAEIQITNFNFTVIDRPIIHSVTVTNSTMVLEFNSVPNVRYRLVRKSECADNEWVQIGDDLIAQDYVSNFTAPVGSASNAFFRVLIPGD